MSTYYGYYCKTCNLESDHSINHGQEQLRELYRVIKKLDGMKLEWVEVQLPNYYDAHDTQLFLNEHIYHDICLINEYGDKEEIEDEPRDKPVADCS